VINGKTILAIVPARGGSKRLPRKNVIPLAEKPLILWTLEAGIKSKYVDMLVVSSDDSEIIKLSNKMGIQTILRPKELSTDEVLVFPLIEHVLDNIDETFDFTICLQPTSPLRNEIHIDEALEFLVQKGADAVISVCEMEHSPLWSNTLPEDKSMGGFLKDDIKGIRSQDLPKYYRINGAIYICKTDRLMNEKTFFIDDNIFAYKMNRISSVDIDVKEDFLLAESFMNNHE